MSPYGIQQGVDLDDAAALERADPRGLLRAVASGAAQVREAAVLTEESRLGELVAEGRPRAVVVCGMGGSGTAGDVLAAVAGVRCPVPVLVHRDSGLPAWVGATDLVVAVSSSGRTEETLSALAEAVRRGSRLLVVGAADSPLAELGARGRAVFVPVPPGRPPRAALWALSVPLIAAAAALGLLEAGADDVEETALTLERAATRCAPDAETAGNPAKQLALELAGTLPLIWGSTPLAGAAAARFASQLHAAAGAPALSSGLPEAARGQVAVLDGPWVPERSGDFFRDRLDDPERPGLHLVLVRDADELPQVAARAEACAQLADERGIGVSVLRAEGRSALARLASLVGVPDFASVYLALSQGTEPTPSTATAALKQRTSS